MGDRLVAADIHVLEFPLSPEHARSGGAWHPTLITLHSASGAWGLGEAGLAYGTGQRAVVAMLQELLEGLVLGRDAQDRLAIWQAMRHQTFWGRSPGPVLGAAISAVDTALWDMAGRVADRPVWALIGDRKHDTLPCYASQIQNGWRADGAWTMLHEPAAYGAAARQAAAGGFAGLKVNPVVITPDGQYQPPDALLETLPGEVLEAAIVRVEAIRDAAPDIQIAVELHGMLSVATAAELITALADFDIAFWEEPVDPGAVVDLNKLAASCPGQPVFAGGERLYSAAQFAPFFDAGLLSLAQPDVGLAGGVTGVLEIADLAARKGVATQMHVCGTPLADQVAAHVGVCLETTLWHETHVNARSPMNRALAEVVQMPVGGKLTPSDAAGFGVSINSDLIEKVGVTIHIKA